MKENNPHILGEAPIGKLLVEYSIPAIIGMTLTSLYNIIDSIFIGHGVGALAISGLAITFPLMNLLVAFCTLVGVGGATLSSIRLGQKDKKGAEDILGNVAILCVINAIFYGGLAFIFLEPILFFFGASEATLPYARDFMQVILLGSPISYVMIGLNNIMRATGYPKKSHAFFHADRRLQHYSGSDFHFCTELGNPGSGTCDHLLTVHRHAVGIVSLLQSEDLYPLPASQHATETTHHSQYFCHRHVALRHECVCLLHRDFHQQPSAQLWR